MASLGHVAVGMAAGRIWNRLQRPRGEQATTVALARSMVAFTALSLAPDLDVIAFRFGIPYGAPWGHRGAAHSICIALLLASVAAFATRMQPGFNKGRTRLRLWLLCAAVAISHGLLDALTDGGLGIALLWPFSNARYFAPWTPIPCGAHRVPDAEPQRVARGGSPPSDVRDAPEPIVVRHRRVGVGEGTVPRSRQDQVSVGEQPHRANLDILLHFGRRVALRRMEALIRSRIG